jgi:hypothetical protein
VTELAPDRAETGSPPVAWRFDRQMIPRLLLVWLAAVVLVQLLQRGFAVPRIKTLGLLLVESVLYLVYFAALLSFEPVRAWVRAVPSPHRTVLAVFFFLATVGQLTVENRRTFPFPAWTMYGRAESPPRLEYYRYHGIDSGGRAVEVDPAKLFTFVNVAEMDSRIRYIGRPASSAGDSATREKARTKVRAWLTAIATAYNRKHPDAPLRSLEFVRFNWEYRRVPVSDVQGESVVRIEVPQGKRP